MKTDKLKQQVAQAALDYIPNNCVLGVGTGSTTNHLIAMLEQVKSKIAVTVASSKQTAKLLQEHGFAVEDLNNAPAIDVYLDGADEANHHRQLIKGGGGALTGEKVIATSARQFICMVTQSKIVDVLGRFPVAVEVIPMARSFVARQIVKLGGVPVYREGFRTDNDNIILDVARLDLVDPGLYERMLNDIPGTVGNGIFSQRRADLVLVAQKSGVSVISPDELG